MSTDEDLRHDIIRVVIFVFVLFSVAEVVAPYMHVSMADPLMLGLFTTQILRLVVASRKKQKVIILKDDQAVELLEKLKASDIQVVDTAGEVVKLIEEAK